MTGAGPPTPSGPIQWAFWGQDVRVELVALFILLLGPGAGFLGDVLPVGLGERFGLPEDHDELSHGGCLGQRSAGKKREKGEKGWEGDA